LAVASATVIAIDEVRHPQGMWVMNIVWPLRELHLSFAGRGRGACREMGGGEENLRYVGFGVVAVVVLAVASALIYRKYLQHETGEQRAIRSAQGIESLEAVSIGGDPAVGRGVRGERGESDSAFYSWRAGDRIHSHGSEISGALGKDVYGGAVGPARGGESTTGSCSGGR